jgi:UDP-N-acetylglucosamine 2-epimerase
MSKIKILSVFGTRAEATKMVPLVMALRDCKDIEARLCVTAQHRELLDQVLAPFHLIPDYDLNLMQAGLGLSEMVARVITGMTGVLEQARPDLLLVHGDTATTFAASLSAFYARVRLGHVEAGLRSFDKYQPFPEEMNRRLTTVLTDLYFAPTHNAKNNLINENIPADFIFVTGNTAIDFTRYTRKDGYVFINEAYRSIDFSRRVLLMTAHRRENWGQPMTDICRAVRRIIDDFPDTFLVWPMHPNPVIRETAQEILGGHERILLTDNADVYDLHNLMARAYLVLTDSGGIQEEAPVFHKPVAVLREVTERPEGLSAGTLTLAGTTEARVYRSVAELLTDDKKYRAMAQAINPFGDGQASARIVRAILHVFGLTSERPKDYA